MTKQVKERFDALSDAIIAIIMTILVLEIKIPSSGKELPSFLYAVGLFLISFIIVFNFWYRRTQIMSVNESLSYKAFVQDVIAHMLLALFPLATKMLVEYQDKWVAILFYGTINFVTALLLSWMTLNLTMQNVKTDTNQQKHNIREFYTKRLIMVSGMDLFSMILALLFNKVGIFLYLVSPFMEFWMNYKRGVIFETAIANGYTFEDYIGGKNQGRQREIATKESKD